MRFKLEKGRSLDYCFFIKLSVLPLRKEEIVQSIFQDIKSQLNGLDKVYWGINPAYLYRGLRYYKEYLNALVNSKRIYADGQTIVWLWNVFIQRAKIPERAATTDLFPLILEKSLSEKARIFLLGSEEEVVRTVYERFRDFGIVGYRNGYFRDEEVARIIDEINSASPDILFVGLGNPKQEKFIIENIDRINAKVIIPCGGLFDHYVKYRRAPKFLVKMGLEWFWRLLQDKFSRYRLRQVRQSFLFIFEFLLWFAFCRLQYCSQERRVSNSLKTKRRTDQLH